MSISSVLQFEELGLCRPIPGLGETAGMSPRVEYLHLYPSTEDGN